jgi:hypothetical protein
VFSELQRAVLRSDVVDYTLQEFERQLSARPGGERAQDDLRQMGQARR